MKSTINPTILSVGAILVSSLVVAYRSVPPLSCPVLSSPFASFVRSPFCVLGNETSFLLSKCASDSIPRRSTLPNPAPLICPGPCDIIDSRNKNKKELQPTVGLPLLHVQRAPLTPIIQSPLS
ncbi:hypothetical protein BGZ61DRAFT_73870 [Ilyonectria robusta]|uniref:uncharacterized protein n=1 Tax=Ilyonectria robusta TaxID=1079257 RepID=UPI001E8CED28|nr:uncharacterized protein BGZ61DRAFT_73870 [Ilyonectria robusta]KAH8677041.1 hypothetical protein BGZ61DRAFT_73870 [Ilyonectria robusta]